jgi:hypothetical protein
MERRTFIRLLGGTALWPLAALAQQDGRAAETKFGRKRKCS